MIDRPRILLAATLLLLATLLHAVDAEPPAVAVAELAEHDGRTVRVQGVVVDAGTTGRGGTLLHLADGDHAVPVTVPGAASVPLGAWVEATGRVGRYQGQWWLHAEAPAVVVPDAEPLRPPWGLLSARPEEWLGKHLEVAGRLDDGLLRGPDGQTLAAGKGPWPDGGAVVATGALAYDADCLCYRLHAAMVRDAAWTST